MPGRFYDTATEDIFNGVKSRDGRRRLPPSLWTVAQRKLSIVLNATTLDSLRVPPGNRLERLAGDRLGQCSIRINDQYRICFSWDDGAVRIEITDYH